MGDGILYNNDSCISHMVDFWSVRMSSVPCDGYEDFADGDVLNNEIFSVVSLVFVMFGNVLHEYVHVLPFVSIFYFT